MVFYCTAFRAGLMQAADKSLTRARSNSRDAEPRQSLVRQMRQSRLCPSDPLPSPELPGCAQLSCLPIPLTPDASLYSKKKMLILQLFVLIYFYLHQIFK